MVVVLLLRPQGLFGRVRAMGRARICGPRGAGRTDAVPYWMPGTYYVNIASQILFYAMFALAMDVLLGYGGLVSLGHAGLFGVVQLWTLVLAAGWGHVAAIVLALIVTWRRWRSSRW